MTTEQEWALEAKIRRLAKELHETQQFILMLVGTLKGLGVPLDSMLADMEAAIEKAKAEDEKRIVVVGPGGT